MRYVKGKTDMLTAMLCTHLGGEGGKVIKVIWQWRYLCARHGHVKFSDNCRTSDGVMMSTQHLQRTGIDSTLQHSTAQHSTDTCSGLALIPHYNTAHYSTAQTRAADWHWFHTTTQHSIAKAPAVDWHWFHTTTQRSTAHCASDSCHIYRLVGWSLTSLFSTKGKGSRGSFKLLR